MFAATRSRCGGLAVLVALLCACATASAWAAVPGGYAVQRVDAPSPAAGGDSFGQRLLAPGDLDGDGVTDVVIASPAAANGEGEVIAVSGADGAPVWDGVLQPVDSASNAADTATHLGTALAVFSDVSGCAPQPAGFNCFSPTSPDGVPELLVSAPGADLNNISAKEIGRVYVVDGASGAIVKRIQLNPAGDLPPAGGKVEFGASVLTVADIDNGGKPDIVVGAPGWNDNFDSNLDCEMSEGSEFGTCLQAGRIFVFFGEAVTGAASSPLNTVGPTIANPFAQDDTSAPAGTEAERFGAALIDTGDVGKCLNPTPTGNANCLDSPPADNSPSDAPDGKPDFVVTAPRFDQDAAIHDSGTVFVVDGASLKIIRKLDSPTPQSGGHFGEITYNGPSVGNIGGSGVPDLFLAAPGAGDAAGQGRAYLLDGNVLAPDPVLGALNDPAPVSGGAFGSAASGVAPGVAVGAPLGARVGTVRIFDRAGGGTLAQTICDPDGQSGAAFGASIATLGDANGDGFDDLAVGAPGFDHPAAANAGRLYILTSKGPAGGGAPEACVSTGGGTTGGGGGGGDAGGGDEATPPDDDDTVVVARVLRRLVLKSARKRVRKKATIRLRGTLSASGNRSVCQKRQKIALQRRKASRGRFQTFEVAITRATGRFTARTIATRTYVYRARVSQTARCMGAVSKTAKVSILRKRGSR